MARVSVFFLSKGDGTGGGGLEEVNLVFLLLRIQIKNKTNIVFFWGGGQSKGGPE